MTDEGTCINLDTSSTTDDNEINERYLDIETENNIELVIDAENFVIPEINSDEIIGNMPQNPSSKGDIVRMTRLPLARIKNIMKNDPDVNVVTADAVFMVTKATELFLETIAKEAYDYTSSKKRKTIVKKDLEHVINVVDCLCFLEGAMDF